jgi:hypothetical protein
MLNPICIIKELQMCYSLELKNTIDAETNFSSTAKEQGNLN